MLFARVLTEPRLNFPEPADPAEIVAPRGLRSQSATSNQTHIAVQAIGGTVKFVGGQCHSLESQRASLASITQISRACLLGIDTAGHQLVSRSAVADTL